MPRSCYRGKAGMVCQRSIESRVLSGLSKHPLVGGDAHGTVIAACPVSDSPPNTAPRFERSDGSRPSLVWAFSPPGGPCTLRLSVNRPSIARRGVLTHRVTAYSKLMGPHPPVPTRGRTSYARA